MVIVQAGFAWRPGEGKTVRGGKDIMCFRSFFFATALAVFCLLATGSMAGDRSEYYQGSREDRSNWQEYQRAHRDERGYDDHGRHSRDRDGRREYREEKHEARKTHRARAGWDADPRDARDAYNCYRYRLHVEQGRGSARIMSLPGRNYIQVSNGDKKGYVCFDGSTTLEIGKFSNPRTGVEFQLEGYGSFSFEPGERGSSLSNGWYRKNFRL